MLSLFSNNCRDSASKVFLKAKWSLSLIIEHVESVTEVQYHYIFLYIGLFYDHYKLYRLKALSRNHRNGRPIVLQNIISSLALQFSETIATVSFVAFATRY